MPGLGANYRKLITASTISNLGDGVATIAYPWLASAITRNPILIAGVAVARGLPWLFFSLPSGVITDRKDRRTLMWTMNALRTVVTIGVAAVVFLNADSLPSADEISDPATVITTQLPLYSLIIVATLALGCAEVLHDNAGVSFLPQIVDKEHLEQANGRMWSLEAAANMFVGPPLGAALLAIGLAVPFIVDAVTFGAAAALVSLISVTAPLRPAKSADGEQHSWTDDIREGFAWLWKHELLRTFAIVLGFFNALMMMTGAVLILFAQEVLETSSVEFAFMMMGGAIGGIAAGWLSGPITERFPHGVLILGALFGSAAIAFIQGATSYWWVVALTSTVGAVLGTIWNVITVSLRQRVIPEELLGRVNSVYRFFGIGMAPIGALAGGVSVKVFDLWLDREMALRATWFLSGGLTLLLALYGSRHFSTAQLQAADPTYESVTS